MAENVEAGLPSALLVTHFDRQIDTLRGTLKWLIASGGAVVAAIVAGTQLTDFSKRGVLGNFLAGGSITVGLILAFALLLGTAKILTIARPTLTDIANVEENEGLIDDRNLAIVEIKNLLMKWIYEREGYLLSPFPKVRPLYLEFTKLTSATQSTLTEDEKSQVADIRNKVDLLESAAHFRIVDLAFTKLMRRFRIGCAIFVVAVILYAVSGLFTKSDIPRVTSPIPVRVIPLNVNPSDTCADRIGVAIAGDIDSPTVMLPPAGKCPAAKLEGGHEDVIVIPLVAPPPTSRP